MKSRISHIALLLIVLSGLLFFTKLGAFSLYDAAETTYGEFVKGILTTGDWLTLHYNGQIIFDKPPLFYWLVALLSKLVGLSEWTMRFWAALAGVLTVATTYLLGKKFYNERAGFFAGLIVMTAFQFVVQSRIAELDIVLTLFMLMSIYLFYLGYTNNDKRSYLLAYVPLGLGLLIKGLLAVALPACTIFLFLLFKKELRKLFDLHLLLGLLLILLIGLPWYIAEYLIHGQVFLDFALGFLFLSRFGGVVSGHTGPWYYYFIALLLGFAPWSQFLPLAFWRTWKRLTTNNPELLTLCFILPAFIVFSIAKTKIPNYILPLYPFLAIMVARLWDELLSWKPETERLGFQQDRKPQRLVAGFLLSHLFFLIIVILIIIAGTIAGTTNYQLEYQAFVPVLIALGSALFIGGLLSLIFFLARKETLSFYTIPVMSAVVVMILVFWALPLAEGFKGTKELGAEVSKAIKPGEAIAAYDAGNRPGVVFYNVKPVVFLSSEAEAKTFLRNKKGYCFTHVSATKNFPGKTLYQKGELAVLR